MYVCSCTNTVHNVSVSNILVRAVRFKFRKLTKYASYKIKMGVFKIFTRILCETFQ